MILSRQRKRIWLHLYMIASVMLYLYSPFIDHSFGFEGQSRPHTHLHIDSVEHHLLNDSLATDTDDDSVLCSLDIDAVLTLLLGLYDPISQVISPQETLSFVWDTPYHAVATLFPLVTTPPPNLL